MSTTQLLGALLFALPFILLFGFLVRVDGWKFATAIFGLTAVVVGVITAGAFLMAGGWT